MMRTTLTSQRAPTHPDVPTSNAPPIREWAGKYWYVIRAAALQARESLTAEESRMLVSAMEALQITLPCGECRGHYVADWAEHPFTDAHARDPVLAIQWVEALRERIAVRKAAEAFVASPDAAPSGPVSTRTRQRAASVPVSVTGTASASASASASMAPIRNLAVRASLLETRANIASGGTRGGCKDCGSRKVRPPDEGVILGRAAVGSGSGAATKYRPLRRR